MSIQGVVKTALDSLHSSSVMTGPA